ncbi:MAG: trypsin-like peptidase domain-containing protein [Pirellulaceae bacterium]
MARWQGSQCCFTARNRFGKLLPFFLVLVAIGLFRTPVLQAQDNAARVYFFTMEGCGPCKEMEPGIDDLIQQGYPITRIDARRQPEWTARFRVTETPTTVFVQGNREVARQKGVLAISAISNWLGNARSSESKTNPAVADTRTSNETENQTKRRLVPGNDRTLAPASTRTAQTEGELAAMRATVRLRVEDKNSYSFGTGTVIHSHDGESLVLTCGHLFRDSQGRGTVTADVNWADEKQVTVPGEVLSYDADAHDVALVVIRPGFHIPAVAVASTNTKIAVGEPAFSIGCDKGQPPTIRATKIKNHAQYDGSHKYDIFGRPSIGRSGGGLFREDGALIGVCNAAAVHEDEGVFTSLDNIHSELGRAKLAHLFQRPDARAIASAEVPVGRLNTPRPAPSDELLALAAEVEAERQGQGIAKPAGPASLPPVPKVRNAGWETEGLAASSPAGREVSDMEVIVLVRSKSDPRNTETIVLDDLPSEFVDELRSRSRATPAEDLRDLAELRKAMPELREAKGLRSQDLRAQSPR